MNYELTGTLKVKKETEKVSDKFQKREFVVTDDNDKYPQHILFQLKQDKCDYLEVYSLGDKVKVTFNLDGREWTKDGITKYFTTLSAWKLENVGEASSTPKEDDKKYASKAEDIESSGLPF